MRRRAAPLLLLSLLSACASLGCRTRNVSRCGPAYPHTFFTPCWKVSSFRPVNSDSFCRSGGHVASCAETMVHVHTNRAAKSVLDMVVSEARKRAVKLC